MSELQERIVREIACLGRRLARLETREQPSWIWLTTAYTNASWDGDAKSDGDSAVLDLSALFGIPASIQAVLISVLARDSGSAAGTPSISVKPTLASSDRCLEVRLEGVTNDGFRSCMAWVPCDDNGDVYVLIDASGASTLDVWLTVWGYIL